MKASSPTGDPIDGAPPAEVTLDASSLNLRPVEAGVPGLLAPEADEGPGKGTFPEIDERLGDGTGAVALALPAGGVGAVTFIEGMMDRSTLF